MKLNLLLLIALILCIAGGFVIRSQPSNPNFEILPEMVRTPAYKAYSANPNFADGKTLQLPPPETRPRGLNSVDFQATDADAIRAGEELHNPYQADDLAAFTRGAFVFRTWCLPCHGATGSGDGQVPKRGFPAPPPFNSAKTLALKDGRMFHILTYGQRNMPSYASQVSANDRWKAILYVRSLQASAQAPPAAPPPSPAKLPVSGKGSQP